MAVIHTSAKKAQLLKAVQYVARSPVQQTATVVDLTQGASPNKTGRTNKPVNMLQASTYEKKRYETVTPKNPVAQTVVV